MWLRVSARLPPAGTVTVVTGACVKVRRYAADDVTVAEEGQDTGAGLVALCPACRPGVGDRDASLKPGRIGHEREEQDRLAQPDGDDIGTCAAEVSAKRGIGPLVASGQTRWSANVVPPVGEVGVGA